MTVDEVARLHLFEQARDRMDEEAARTLMAVLPWDIDKLASKVDLENVENRLNSRADRRLAYLMISIVGTIIAMTAVLLTAVQGLR